MDDHVAQHNDASDALAAIAAKVGESGTEDTSTLWYKAEHVDTDQIVDGAVLLVKLTAAVENLLIPAGTMQDYAGATVPTGWLALDGQTITDADTTYPELWSVAPAAWKSGTSLTLVDARDRYFVMDSAGALGTMGSTVGSNTFDPTMIEHRHDMSNHTHNSTGISTHSHTIGNHSHVAQGSWGNNSSYFDYYGPSGTIWSNNVATSNNVNSGAANTNFGTPVTTAGPGGTTAPPNSNLNSGNNTTNDALATIDPQYIVFKKIIKAH
jgi:hypothetical protein